MIFWKQGFSLCSQGFPAIQRFLTVSAYLILVLKAFIIRLAKIQFLNQSSHMYSLQDWVIQAP